MKEETLLYIKTVNKEYYGFITTFNSLEKNRKTRKSDMHATTLKKAIIEAQKLCKEKQIDCGYWFINLL